MLHEPAILILDEPTSGVDPIARDAFWRTLIDLSRNDGVTIFITTHFMNEAERCDRISLMHAGKVLAVGAPQDLVKERGSDSIEDAFVGYLAEAAGNRHARRRSKRRRRRRRRRRGAGPPNEALQPGAPVGLCAARDGRAVARSNPDCLRHIRADHLMLAFGYGISFDIENLQVAAFDQDDTPQSRELLDASGLAIFLRADPDRLRR